MIVRELRELLEMFPPDIPVYVRFDGFAIRKFLEVNHDTDDPRTATYVEIEELGM